LGAAQINAFLFCFLPTGLGVAQINAFHFVFYQQVLGLPKTLDFD
jgi:hypothetical protein